MSAVVHRTTPSGAQAVAAGCYDRMLAFESGQSHSLEQFLSHVRGLADVLPRGQYAINLCDDRYRFLVAFCAVALREQITLLPSSRAPKVVTDVLDEYADSYTLGDGALSPQPPRYWQMPGELPEREGSLPMIADDAVVAIGFTSGSTGAPTRSCKTWASFRTSTAQNLAALDDLWPTDALPSVVATVPPQHMYGMELSVMLPLIGPAAVHSSRPFFPADVARALTEIPEPRLLVTTPVHLRALVQSGVTLPAMCGIVSVTAPLSSDLALAAEQHFGCEVRELFGSTETCIIARRRTAMDSAWTPLPGVRMQPQPDGASVHAAHLAAPVPLADLVEVESDGRFHLRGRQADLLEIAGKRASLAELTRRLLAIPGVIDGVVLQLDAAQGKAVGRVAALCVAPSLDEATILAALRESVDPVFLPRPLKRVDALPRSEAGKLPRAELLRLF